MKNVMIDLETMGSGPCSAIVAIGACFFEVGSTGPEFYQRVTLQSCVDVGLQLDTSTVLWWMAQEDAARREIHDPLVERVHIGDALCRLTQFLYINNFDDSSSIWGNGSDFDNVLLVSAYKACQLELPWKFWQHRCYRTLKSLRPSMRIPRNGTHHNALDDARSQAAHAVDLLRSLGIKDNLL